MGVNHECWLKQSARTTSPRHEFLLKTAIRHSFAITVAKAVFIKDNPNYQRC